MSSVFLRDVGGLAPFDCSDTAGISARWERWLRAFELFADGKGVKHADQKKALMLHTAGLSVQDIFFTLDEGTGENNYLKAKDALDKYFKPQANVPYERLCFREMSQLPSETVEQFVTRLRQKAQSCEFGDAAAVDEQIRDQVISKCLSHNIRRKLLEKGKILTLQQLREIARVMEDSEKQARKIESAANEVNRVSVNSNGKGNPRVGGKQSTVRCFCCGNVGHKANDKVCPARRKRCRKCNNLGHFEKVCKTKLKTSEGRKGGKDRRVRQVGVGVDETDDSEYAFGVLGGADNPDNGEISVKIGGVQVTMIIDSGASCNVLDRNLWEYLKANKVRCVSSKATKKLYSYGNKQPLQVAGTFTADVLVGNRVLNEVEFVVIESEGHALLGRETVIALGVLQLGPQINSLQLSTDGENRGPNILDKFPGCCEGIGKLKDFQLKIPIDAEVQPVAQPIRRVPYHLRDKLTNKLKELVELDIIEKVSGPSTWVSPVVVVPKPTGDIRLCVDMRQANMAVKRERYPMPTIDEVLQDLNQSKFFSKLDLNSAYHQIELAPESRDITTFGTHDGLYRYKRLMFGISCAPEMYQKVIRQVLQDCEGAHNILDDVIVHATTEEEHDQRFENVVRVLSSKGLTLNRNKCQFKMSHLEFMGHVLSARGIGPADVKVKAVVEAREPKNAAEVRSFLGLVNFTARFIPDLSTVSAPLRRLTKNGEPFVWDHEEQQSFDELKKRLASAEILGYFDKNAQTKVIADASPVGLGAVLVQQQGEELRVISYASRSLSDTERRYSQTEKEALAIVWACERFHAYLYGAEFELMTDHKPLECIFSPKSKTCARIERWLLRIQPYKFSVKYIPGPKNIADSLSRLLHPTSNLKEKSQTDEYVEWVAQESTPVALTTREIESASEEDPELQSVRECLLSGRWHDIEFKEYLPMRGELCAIGKLVLRGTRIVVPKELRSHVLELAHEGHPGIVAMKQRLRSKLWWPGLDKDAERVCKTCHGCQLVSQPLKPEPMTRTEFPSAPWQHLAFDLLGPLPSGDYIFVVVDYYSRFFEMEFTKSITTEKIVSLMSKMFVTHGLPCSLRTDNGPQFISDHFKGYLEKNGIEHRRTTPLWPQANGEIERQNRTILKRLRISQAEGRDWRSQMDDFLMMYRSTPHSTTGVSPAELLFGRKIRTKLPQLQEFTCDDEVRDRDSERKEKGKMYADCKRNACENDIQKGDKVLLRQERDNKLSTPFKQVPFTVVQKNGNSVLVEADGV